jgi:hypothetical protein
LCCYWDFTTTLKTFFLSRSLISGILKNYTTPIEENQVIQLPEDVFILGNPNIGSSIFIRYCYPKLLQTVLSIIHSKTTRTLGFGTEFKRRLMVGAHVLKSQDYLIKAQQDDFVTFLDMDTTFYIVDAQEPVDVVAKTILISYRRKIDGPI